MIGGHLRSRLVSDAAAFGLWCTAGSALLAETGAAEGCDYVCVDLQHGATATSDLLSMMSAVNAAGPATPLVRVLRADAGEIGKALDAGAEGVVVPMVDTPEEAASAVRACRYPPTGDRSYGPFRSSMRVHRQRSLREIDELVLCFVMVETAEGLRRLEAICSTEGLSGIYVGPSDLTVALGGDPRDASPLPGLDDALSRIAAACSENGLVPGIHAKGIKDVEHYLGLGFKMITLGTDWLLFQGMLSATLAEARHHASLGGGPD